MKIQHNEVQWHVICAYKPRRHIRLYTWCEH